MGLMKPEIIGFVVITAVILIFITMGALGYWTYRDAKSRGLDAGLWVALVIFVPNLIGFLLYLLWGRKQQRVVCRSCNSKTEVDRPYCSNCGNAIEGGTHRSATTGTSVSKLPLISAMLSIMLMFSLIIGAAVFSLSDQQEMFTSKNITIGQAQTMRSGIWKLSFWYFDGEKARAIQVDREENDVLRIEAQISKGTVDFGISVDGREERRIRLNDLDDMYLWDLSQYPDDSRIVLHLYGEQSRGKLKMEWR